MYIPDIDKYKKPEFWWSFIKVFGIFLAIFLISYLLFGNMLIK